MNRYIRIHGKARKNSFILEFLYLAMEERAQNATACFQ